MVDGLISKQHNPEIIKALESLLITFQKNRNAAMDEFISFLSKKPMTTELINSIKTTAAETPTDAGVVILRDEIELTDFEAALTRVKKPLVFAYTPSLQKNADFLKAKLGEKVQLVRFEESGHALFADEPAKFNQMIRKQLDAK
ncbi:MAG: alpha/beta hydrolase [Proteobacteria bacterium]|nr:MAG: alpha/beta hydrolase [Pseudomonadota bacterium]